VTDASAAGGGDGCIAVCAGRDRVRALVRRTFPKRRTRVVFARGAPALLHTLRAELVDAVLVDVGATGDAGWPAVDLAALFPSTPFFAVAPLRASEGGALERCVAIGAAGVIVDGVDDGAVRELLAPSLFTARFARAFREPPPSFVLSSPLQRSAWARLVASAGRVTRTDAVARALGVSREHLSRSFGDGFPRLKHLVDIVRLAAATELARNPGHQIRDVAAIFGFASSSHLARAARRLVAAAPLELRALGGAELLECFTARHAARPSPPARRAGRTRDQASASPDVSGAAGSLDAARLPPSASAPS
jgi:AraC-like DNA-binding protein